MTLRTLPLLRTARCLLDPLGPDRARGLLDGRGDVVPAGPGWPHADSLAAVRAALELGWPTWLVRIGEESGDGEIGEPGDLIGEIGLKGWPDGSGTVEVGYGLAAPVRRKGIGREVLSAVLDWLPALEVQRVIAEVAVHNVASRRLVESLGFTVERTVRAFVYYELALGPEG